MNALCVLIQCYTQLNFYCDVDCISTDLTRCLHYLKGDNQSPKRMSVTAISSIF